MSEGFSKLESTILKSKGLSDEQLVLLSEVGIGSKADFHTIGDAATLADITGLSAEVADKVMHWALGVPSAPTKLAEPAPVAPNQPIIVDGSDVVYCQHCQTRQPKDYKSGDLCPNCGKQAEITQTCYWCAHVGPGQFCRNCGTKFVPFAELELAVQLRREGYPKDDIASKLEAMSQVDKDTLWARIRARS